jgi:hypothetical protein
MGKQSQSLAQVLLDAKPRLYKKVEICVGEGGDDGKTVTVALRRPPPAVLPEVLGATNAAELQREGGSMEEQRTRMEQGILLLARLAAACIYELEAVRPLWNFNNAQDVEALAKAPWLLELHEDLLACAGAAGVTVERLKGK